MNKMKIFIYIIIIIVVSAIVAGFFIVDSPKESRLKKFDEQKISNLSFLQSEILNFWMRKGKLPENLDALRDDLRGIAIPLDPETQGSYTYRIIDVKNLKFSLCAVFSRPSQESVFSKSAYPGEQYPFGGQNWEHDAGMVCFERIIDPELYPVSKR